METSIEKVNPNVEALSLQTTQSMAEIFIKSGFFPDIKTASQGIVKILAGREIGLAPIQSMQHVFVIPSQNGPKIQLSGNVMAAKIRQSGRYDYRIIESTDKACEIEFYQLPERLKLGNYRFTWEDAVKAGLTGKSNWKSYPRDMLFNRAISGGYKQHCPDIFNLTVYSEADEFEPITEPGQLPDNLEPQKNLDFVKSAMQEAKSPKNGTKPVQPTNLPIEQPQVKPADERPYQPEILKKRINDKALSFINAQFDITPYNLKHVNIALSVLCCGNDEKRLKLIEYFFNKQSSKELRESEALALMAWMQYDSEKYSPAWIPNDFAIEEYELLIKQLTNQPTANIIEKDIAFADALFGKAGS